MIVAGLSGLTKTGKTVIVEWELCSLQLGLQFSFMNASAQQENHTPIVQPLRGFHSTMTKNLRLRRKHNFNEIKLNWLAGGFAASNHHQIENSFAEKY